ncbi:MAG: ABC transporter ATP-binding protein [Polyangiales bacterium]
MEVAAVSPSAAPAAMSFEPVAEASRYPPPVAGLSPDKTRGWLGRLLPVVLARKALLYSAIAASALSMLTSVAAPAVLGLAINDALGSGHVKPSVVRGALIALAHACGLPDARAVGRLTLEGYLLALLVLGVVRAVSSGYYRYGLYRVAYHIETDLRSIIYDHLIRLPFSFYDRVQSGQIISRANSDIRSLQMLLTFAPMMIVSWLSFALALSFMLSVHVGLTLAAVFALPGIFAVGAHMRREMFPLSWMIQSRLADLATVVDESIQGVRVVKSFAAEKRQIGALAKVARRVLWAATELVETRARHAPLMENIARLGPAFVLLYGGWLVLQGRIEGVGTLVTFNTYMIMLQAPFRVLGFFMSLSQRAEASAARIFEILDEPIAIEDKPGAQDLPEPRGHVELRDVSFGYAGGRKVLEGFSLELRPGETVALVGRTGCGKSTVARLLPRFYDVGSGAVLIDGHDVRDVTLVSLRARIGLALDEPFLFSMSVRDNIAYGKPQATQDEVITAAKAAEAHEFITELEQGYDTVVGERGYTLSGGQRQRIALARLFLLNPAVVVLDDATSAIDVQIEAQILDALEKLLEHRTTLIVAHRESTLRLADRVVLMEDGKIVASGTHEALMRDEPRYAAVLAHAQHATPRVRPQRKPPAGMAERLRGLGGSPLGVPGGFGGDGPPGGLGL